MEAESVEVSELEDRVEEDRLDDRPNEERTIDNRVGNDKSSYKVIDGKKVLVYKGKVAGGDGANMPSKLIEADSKILSKSALKESAYDTEDGSATIFWYKDLDGKIYFILEQKTGHPNPEVRDKYALIGETAQVGEHAATEIMIRGIKEEDPKSSEVLLQALIDNGYKFDEIRSRLDGRLSILTIYTAQIIGLQNIEKVKYSKLTEGQKAIVSLEEVVDLLNKGSFAYGDKVIRDFIVTNSHKFFEYKPQMYASDISFKHNPFPLAIPIRANTYNLNQN